MDSEKAKILKDTNSIEKALEHFKFQLKEQISYAESTVKEIDAALEQLWGVQYHVEYGEQEDG